MTTPSLSRRTLLATVAVTVGSAMGVSLRQLLTSAESDKIGKPVRSLDLTIRHRPVVTPPHCQLADLVPVDRLRDFLKTLAPCWLDVSPKIDKVIHAFRLWGPREEFSTKVFVRPFRDRTILTGQEMEQILLDSKRFQDIYQMDPPILTSYSDGVTVRSWYSPVNGSQIGGLMHQDKLLRALSERGYDSTTPIVAVKGDVKVINGTVPPNVLVKSTLEDIVRGSVAYFDATQELEWTAEGLARYLAPTSKWTNRFGETYSFDQIATNLTLRPLDAGSCFGIHITYSLTCLYRINEQFSIISDVVRSRIETHLRRRTAWIESNQASYEVLLRTGSRPGKQDPAEDRSKWINTDEVTIIGHDLEWIALAPESLRPKRATVQRLVDVALKGIELWSIYVRSGDYCPLTHVGLALCHLVGQSASDVVHGPFVPGSQNGITS